MALRMVQTRWAVSQKSDAAGNNFMRGAVRTGAADTWPRGQFRSQRQSPHAIHGESLLKLSGEGEGPQPLFASWLPGHNALAWSFCYFAIPGTRSWSIAYQYSSQKCTRGSFHADIPELGIVAAGTLSCIWSLASGEGTLASPAFPVCATAGLSSKRSMGLPLLLFTVIVRM